MNFSLDEEQESLLRVWLAEMEGRYGDKYYGAIGGAFTYSFTPTSLGVIVKVTHVDGGEIDLTDYMSW